MIWKAEVVYTRGRACRLCSVRYPGMARSSSRTLRKLPRGVRWKRRTNRILDGRWGLAVSEAAPLSHRGTPPNERKFPDALHARHRKPRQDVCQVSAQVQPQPVGGPDVGTGPSTTDRIAATLGAASALPMCVQFLRPNATPRIGFSAKLALSSNLPVLHKPHQLGPQSQGVGCALPSALAGSAVALTASSSARSTSSFGGGAGRHRHSRDASPC
jgi:hypothetical protein